MPLAGHHRKDVQQAGEQGFQTFPGSVRASGQVDYQTLPPDPGLAAGEHGIGRTLLAVTPNGLAYAGHGAVEHLDAQGLFEVAGLGGREIVVEDDHVGLGIQPRQPTGNASVEVISARVEEVFNHPVALLECSYVHWCRFKFLASLEVEQQFFQTRVTGANSVNKIMKHWWEREE